MKYVDATKDRARPLMRAWRRRLHGAAARAVISATPTATWGASLPALARAADLAQREILRLELHRLGRDPDGEFFAANYAERSEFVKLAAATMLPDRAVEILVVVGVERGLAVRLICAVGPTVADALAWLDVVDVVPLARETRGAA